METDSMTGRDEGEGDNLPLRAGQRHVTRWGSLELAVRDTPEPSRILNR